MAHSNVSQADYPSPHRLTLLRPNGCDMCQYTKTPPTFSDSVSASEYYAWTSRFLSAECTHCSSGRLKAVGGDIHFGWQVCDCLPCQDLFTKTYNYYIVENVYSLLHLEPNSLINVLRSNGTMDEDWEPVVGLRTDDGSFEIVVKGPGGIQKNVPLQSLIEWNTKKV